MTRSGAILLALDDLGAGVQFVDALESLGYSVTWARTDKAMPAGGGEPPKAVGIHGDPEALDVAACVRAWRTLDPPPACLIVGTTERARALADRLNAVFVPSSSGRGELDALFERAIRLRYTAELSLAFGLRALGIAPSGVIDGGGAALLVSRARTANVDGVREALRRHMHSYATATDAIAALREDRVLQVPELELIDRLDGSITVKRAVQTGRGGPEATARSLWAVACVGGVTFSPEPPDVSTPARRAVVERRGHIRARLARLRKGRATYYDVLEVPLRAPPDAVRAAAQLLGARYSPAAVAELDLGDLTDTIPPLWAQIEKACAMLADPDDSARYVLYLRGKGIDLERAYADRGIDPAGAEDAFGFGQRALSAGDVFKAVSSFAAAARKLPDHPDYEAYLAWARYRADVQRGADKDATAARERDAALAACAGRQPRPRASLALGLLCAAAGDADAARWHLAEALALDPELAHARQLLDRMR